MLNRRTMVVAGAAALLSQKVEAALINPATFSESLLYCTVKITAKVGSHTRSGTGFIFDFISGTNSVPTLITNTHVIEGATEIKFRIHTQSKDGTPDGNLEITAPGSTSGSWITHPDEAIDLC